MVASSSSCDGEQISYQEFSNWWCACRSHGSSIRLYVCTHPRHSHSCPRVVLNRDIQRKKFIKEQAKLDAQLSAGAGSAAAEAAAEYLDTPIEKLDLPTVALGSTREKVWQIKGANAISLTHILSCKGNDGGISRHPPLAPRHLLLGLAVQGGEREADRAADGCDGVQPRAVRTRAVLGLMTWLQRRERGAL
eukprot:SAG11_NODE_1819_length_4212_cov_12.081935_3_plen_192_part_00